jgi:hypothetical protein
LPHQNKSGMQQKLFVTCPFSHLEPFIAAHFSGNHFFGTAMALGINKFEDESLEALAQTIQQHRIQELYLAQDLDCRFLKNTIDPTLKIGTPRAAEMEHCKKILSIECTSAKEIHQVALVHLQNQINFLNTYPIFQTLVGSQNLKINGIITSKKEKRIQLFQNTSYGLASAD